MEAWLKEAIKAIEADARCAYGMCEDTALKENLELDFVIEKFLEAFRKNAKKGDGHE